MMTGADYPSSVPAPPTCPDPGGPLPPSPALPSESGYPDTAQPTGVGPPLCTGCSQPILDPFILRLQGQMWHSRCLRCCVCHMVLSHVCYSGNSQLYCHDDFFRYFVINCSSCNGAIPPSDLVRRAHDNVYHLDCFRCRACRRELCTGDEYYLCLDGLLFCKADYLAVKAKELGQDENVNPNGQSPNSKEERERHLLHYYQQNAKPKRDDIEKIALELGIEPSTVRGWFRQQRAKDRCKGSDCENTLSTQNDMTNRVHPPPGGYPMPIVNKTASLGEMPEAANFPANQSLSSTQMPAHMLGNHTQWTAWDELWSNDFVPPNVDLQPDHIKNGEVVNFSSPTSLPCFSQHHLQGSNNNSGLHQSPSLLPPSLHHLHHQMMQHQHQSMDSNNAANNNNNNNNSHNVMSNVAWVS